MGVGFCTSGIGHHRISTIAVRETIHFMVVLDFREKGISMISQRYGDVDKHLGGGNGTLAVDRPLLRPLGHRSAPPLVGPATSLSAISDPLPIFRRNGRAIQV